MKSSSIQLLLTGVAACISLTCLMTPTYGSSIVIGGNWTDIGTITFISPKPGDSPTTAGTALLNTINGITDNSATNPYVIKLGPGIYDIGTSSVQMKPYVDVEGSGENATIITGHIDSFTSGVVLGADNVEIRFLTVQNIGGGNDAVAIFNASASPKMTNVTVSGSGTVSSSYGVYNFNGGTIRINHSVIKGTTNTIFNDSGTTTLVGNTQLHGGGVSNSGTLTCVGAYNGDYVALNTSCL